MATGGGVKEVGVRLKVGATGAEQLDKLGASLRTLGVDTEALDQQAAALATEMATSADTSAELAQAHDKLAPVTRTAAKAAQDLAAAAEQGGQGLGTLGGGSESARRKLSEMKVELAAAGAAAYTIGRALGSATRDAAAFETGMAEVSTLVSDVSGMTAQAEAVRALAREYGGDAAAQARALYQIISAGATAGAQATGVLDQANRLAVGGVTDITTAADGLTSILNAYGAQAGTAAQVSDALFVAMKSGKTTVGELSSGIGQVAPIAAQAGVGLEQLLAATAALTKGGTSTSESLTQLRGLITAIIKPSAEAQQMAADLGFAFDAQALKAKGLAGFLAEVQAKTGGNTEVMAKMFGSVEALGAVLALTGSQSGSFSETLEGMKNRAGATDEAFAKMAQTSGFAGKQFAAALDDARISMGQALTALTPLVETVTGALNLFNAMPEPVRVAGGAVVALGLVVGPLALSVASLSRAVGLASVALGTKAAAAAATVVPLAAAAAASTTLATASAATVAPVTAAAGATSLLARAASVLLGPVGLAVAALSLLVPEFLRTKQAAEDGDEAVRKMLAGPDKPQLPAKAEAAAKATAAAGKAADQAADQHQKLESAARLAAAELGVDLAAASNKVSLTYSKQLSQLDDLVAGMPRLKEAGVDTAKVVEAALAKMIDGAKNQAELDTLKTRIEALGKAGELSKDQVVSLMETLAKKAQDATTVLTQTEKAMKALGLTTQREAQKMADDLGKAWATIRDDATVSLKQKQAAFTRYAEAAIAANGGVADSTLKSQAQALQLAIEFDKTGKAIVRAAKSGADGMRELADETKNAATQAISLSSSWEAAKKSREASMDAELKAREPVRTAAGQLNPPDNSGNWVFDDAAFNRDQNQAVVQSKFPVDYSRYWKLSPEAAAAESARAADPSRYWNNAQPAAGTQGGSVTMNVTIGGSNFVIVANSTKDADNALRALEEAFRAGGGGGG